MFQPNATWRPLGSGHRFSNNKYFTDPLRFIVMKDTTTSPIISPRLLSWNLQ